MMRWRNLFLLLPAVWLVSGIYIVRGNEQAVLQRAGRLVTTSAGQPRIVGSGLHCDLPWPFSTVHRLNLNEVRTLSVGLSETDIPSETNILQPVGEAAGSQFLTGDRNILNLQVTAQYRIAGSAIGQYLFASRNPEARLRRLLEAAVADSVSRSGVDYVHPLGLAELRILLTRAVRDAVEAADLGIEIDEVSVSSVHPPVRVKAYFLDVSNARADYEKYIHSARSYEEQKLAAGRAEADRLLNEARAAARSTLAEAAGSADRFRSLTGQFSETSSAAAARRMALGRLYFEAVQEIMGRVKGKVVLDTGQSVDLTIFADPAE